MNRKTKLFLLFICICGYINVNAASNCSYSEQATLNAEAANVKAMYEERTGFLDPSEVSCEIEDNCKVEYNYFEISVLNLSPKFYAIVTDENNSSTKTIRYSDTKDGIASFDFVGIMNLNTFTFKVYSSSETSCPNELYYTFNLKTPRKNAYANNIQCKENSEASACQKYVDYEDTGYNGFMAKLKKYEKEKNETSENQNKLTFIQKTINFVKENKIPIIVAIVILVIGVGTTAFVVIRKRKRSVL